MLQRHPASVQWAKSVKARDNNKCVICGAPGIHAHHILYSDYFPELRNDINNGVTVCRLCHIAAHRGTFIAGSDSKPNKNQAIMYLLARANNNPVDLSLLERIVDGDIVSSAKARQIAIDEHRPVCYNPASSKHYSPWELRAREKHIPKWKKEIIVAVGME